MTTPHTYITTTIPYVNARPHLGFALELVQADVLARHHRRVGDRVRFQTGTDENALKNVLAAEAAGVGVQEFVDANAAAFLGLAGPLSLSVDDVIRTSRDPRHRAGAERFWRACADAGDLYRKQYEGLYCVGCEQFYTEDELADGRCPEHGTVPAPQRRLIKVPPAGALSAAGACRRLQRPRRALVSATSMPCGRSRFSPRILRLAWSVSCG